MTLEAYCEYLGWTTAELARNSGIAWRTADNAVRGMSISKRVARQIATALTRAMGQTVHPGDIVGLKFS